MPKTTGVGVAVALFVLFYTPNVFSCSCIRGLSLCETLAHASVVAFVGRVIDDGQGKKNVRFEVEEVFKGLTSGRKQVDVDPSLGTTCQVGFTKGERYIVFAHAGYNGQLSTGGCSGSASVVDSGDVISNLRAWRAGATKTTLHGRIESETLLPRSFLPSPVTGVEVVALGGKARHVTTTDAMGEFRIEDVTPGDYNVTFSGALDVSRKPYRLVLAEPACSRIGIRLATLSWVSGRVFDDWGLQTDDLSARLGLSQEGGSVRFPIKSATETHGWFDFLKLPPGRYLPGIDADNVGTTAPSTVFYITVSDQDSVSVLRNSPSLRTRTIDLRLECAAGFASPTCR